LMFDLDPNEGLRRAADVWGGDGPDRYESEDLEQQEARRRGFLNIAKSEPNRCVVIDAAPDAVDVENSVRRAVEDYLKRADAPPVSKTKANTTRQKKAQKTSAKAGQTAKRKTGKKTLA